jgi:hypothetical protein
MNIFDTLYPMDENKNGIEKLPIFPKKFSRLFNSFFISKAFGDKIG